MQNDSLLRKMREAVRPHLPKGAFLRRDRGDALLITNARMVDPAFCAVPDFIAEPRGGMIALTPDDAWIAAFEREHAPIGHFGRSLIRFAGQKPTPEARALFVRGAKLAECRPSAGEIIDFDRAVRRLAAAALRTGAGGGIYALAVLDEILNL